MEGTTGAASADDGCSISIDPEAEAFVALVNSIRAICSRRGITDVDDPRLVEMVGRYRDAGYSNLAPSSIFPSSSPPLPSPPPVAAASGGTAIATYPSLPRLLTRDDDDDDDDDGIEGMRYDASFLSSSPMSVTLVQSLPREEDDDDGGGDRSGGAGGLGGTAVTANDDGDVDDDGGGGGGPPPSMPLPSLEEKGGNENDCRRSLVSKCSENGGYNPLTYTLLLTSFVVLIFISSVISTYLGYNNVAYRDWALAGGVTSTSATFRVRGPSTDDGIRREFVVSSNPNLAIEIDQILNVPVAYGDYALDEHGMKSLLLESLTPRTAYYYGITRPQRTTNSAVVAGEVGFFVTPAPEGSRMDFTVATGSCALTGSKSSLFSDVLSLNPLLFIHMGDLHYEDLNTLDVDERLIAYDRVMGSPSQRLLYMRTIFAYMWDDHDWLGNNQDSEDEDAGSVAKQTYSLGIPHYPLGTSSADTANAAKYQAFTIGTVRFILTDLRSESYRSTEYFPGRIYSAEQKEWLFNELAQAANYDFVVWVSTRPWTEPVKVGSDSWGGFVGDRDELSAFIAATIGAGPRNLLVLSGDNHMVAFDDGSSTDFSGQDVYPGGFPLLHSGPLTNYGPGATDFFKPEKFYFTDGCMAYSNEVNHQFSTVDFSFPSDVNQLGCMRIRSYSNDASNIIFEKELCGEVMKYGTPQQETCTIKRMTVPTWSIFTAAAGFVALGAILSLWKLGRRRIALALGYIGLGVLFYILMIGAAVAGALCFGQIGINIFPVSIWVLAQAFVGCLFVVMAINGHCASTCDDNKGAANGTFDEESALKAVVNEEDEERSEEQAKSTQHVDEEVNMLTTYDNIMHPVEGSIVVDAAEGGYDPKSSNTKNASTESASLVLNTTGDSAASLILRDLAQSGSKSPNVASGDRNAGGNQSTNSSEMQKIASDANNFDESTEQSPAKAMKRDSSAIRKMKQALVDSRSKEGDEVLVSDKLSVVSPCENDVVPYPAGIAACGLNQPFEDVFSFARNFFSYGNSEDKRAPASPGESYFRLIDDGVTKDDTVEEGGKQPDVTNPTAR